MIVAQNYGAHSARVEMQLLLRGATIGIAQMGPDFLILESAAAHPPGEATIILQVDDSERRWNVLLPHGISADSTRVVIAVSA